MSLDRLALLDGAGRQPLPADTERAPERRRQRTVVALSQHQTAAGSVTKAHQTSERTERAPGRCQVDTERAPNEHPDSAKPPPVLASRNYRARIGFRVEDQMLEELEGLAVELGYRPADLLKTAVVALLQRYDR
jgi:hypothetical protein